MISIKLTKTTDFTLFLENQRQKCRAWPKSEEEKGGRKGVKRPFFNLGGGETSEKARAWPLFSRKSLSVEQFSCTNFVLSPTFYLLTTTKKIRSPTEGDRWPSLFSTGQFLLLHFFRAISKKRGGVFRSKSITYPQNTPKTTPYISDSPPPPERQACG